MDIKVDINTVIVFDLDDTLYSELDFLISAYKKITNFLDKENEKKLFLILLSLYRNKENVFGFLEKNYDTNKEELLDIYRYHLPEIKASKGVKRIFKSIKKNQGKIAVITDGRSITQRNKIKALGLNSFIDFIVISEEIKLEKPSEKSFRMVMDKFPVKKYYYIADNLKKDFISPNMLGWGSVGVIDQGKNIHPNSYLHQKEEKTPQSLVYQINDINII